MTVTETVCNGIGVKGKCRICVAMIFSTNNRCTAVRRTLAQTDPTPLEAAARAVVNYKAKVEAERPYSHMLVIPYDFAKLIDALAAALPEVAE